MQTTVQTRQINKIYSNSSTLLCFCFVFKEHTSNNLCIISCCCRCCSCYWYYCCCCLCMKMSMSVCCCYKFKYSTITSATLQLCTHTYAYNQQIHTHQACISFHVCKFSFFYLFIWGTKVKAWDSYALHYQIISKKSKNKNLFFWCQGYQMLKILGLSLI